MLEDDVEYLRRSVIAEEVTNLGSTLFAEIAKTADDIWHKVYEGRSVVTHKALSPLRTLHQKLVGLSFVEPHVTPVADILDTALKGMPPKGNITGSDLILLQGLVCLLRDSEALVAQAQCLIDGYAPDSVLDSLFGVPQSQHSQTISSEEPFTDAGSDPLLNDVETSDVEEEPLSENQPTKGIFPPQSHQSISSLGLW